MLSRLLFKPQRRQSMTCVPARSSISSPYSANRARRSQEEPTPRSSRHDNEDCGSNLRALIEEENEAYQVVVWSKSPSSDCDAAKDLLFRQIKGLDVMIHDLAKAPQGPIVLEELSTMATVTTAATTTATTRDVGEKLPQKSVVFAVPIIFIHGKHIGGNQELQHLYHSTDDALEKLLFPDILDGDTKFRAVFKGMVIAESETTVVVGIKHPQHYFPPESVRWNLLLEENTTNNNMTDQAVVATTATTSTFCASQGEATRYTILIKDKSFTSLAWSYKSPKPEFHNLKDYVVFSDNVAILKGRKLVTYQRTTQHLHQQQQQQQYNG